MREIIFTVTHDAKAGGYCASWDDPRGGGIATQGDDFTDLDLMIRDAVEGYFDVKGTAAPRKVRLHFTDDPVLELAR